MAEARGRAAWAHTSSIMALVANVNRDPKKTRAFRPSDFNPYAERSPRGTPLTAGNIGLLRSLVPKKEAGSE